MKTIMPMKGQLSMHASENVGANKDISLLFGLSGTGKVTFNVDPNTLMIGDYKHVWTDDGVFNIDGGCCAKC